MSKSRAASAHGVAGRHVRLHCYARCMSSGPDWSGGSGSTQAPDPHAAQHAGQFPSCGPCPVLLAAPTRSLCSPGGFNPVAIEQALLQA